MVIIKNHKCELKYMPELKTIGFFVDGIYQCALTQDNTRHWMLTFDKFLKDISQILKIEEQETTANGYQFIPSGWKFDSYEIKGMGIMNHKFNVRYAYLIEELLTAQCIVDKIELIFLSNDKINVISSEHQVKTLDTGGK